MDKFRAAAATANDGAQTDSVVGIFDVSVAITRGGVSCTDEIVL